MLWKFTLSKIEKAVDSPKLLPKIQDLPHKYPWKFAYSVKKLFDFQRHTFFVFEKHHPIENLITKAKLENMLKQY